MGHDSCFCPISSKDKNLKGILEDIKDDDEQDPDEMTYFQNKIIYININHPLFLYHKRNKEGINSLQYRMIYADAIVREYCNELTRNDLKPFENLPALEYRDKYEIKFNKLYKKYSSILHKICIDPKLIKILKSD